MEEYTYGITRRGIRPHGHLAQYRGWPETRYWAWRQTAPPSLTAGGAWRIPPGFTVRGTELGEKKTLVSPGEGEWRSKRDTGQFFPPITYPTHGKKLAQRGDCRILRRCSVSPSPQLCRCLPKRRCAPTHERRQHSWWSEPSPPGGTARLATGTPRRRPPLSSGPTSVWRQPSLSAALRGRQRAGNSGYIHFQGGGWQPTLQTFLQERKHYSNRASSGVFSARRTPGREQTPFQCVGLPCWRSSSLNDGLYHRRW